MNSLAVLISAFVVSASAPQSSSTDTAGYRMDSPGTITFTTGLKIHGKVEKPQVMIFLPKEKSYFRDMDFDKSYVPDITKPLDQPLMSW